MDGNGAESSPAGTGRPERRTPHSIRFQDPEWERIEAFAEERGLTGPEFVRFAALAALVDDAPAINSGDRLAPLIEMTFRAAYIMVSKLRRDMLDEGRGEELDALIAGARGLQDEILAEESNEEER